MEHASSVLLQVAAYSAIALVASVVIVKKLWDYFS